MAVQWKALVVGVGIVALCFFGIPLKVDKSDVSEHEELFKYFIKKFNKSYEGNTSEYSDRFYKFKESLQMIKKLNEDRPYDQSAVYGITKFSDMSSEEFLNHHLQPELHKRLKHNHHHKHKSDNHIEKRDVNQMASLPFHVDWRDRKVVTPVRNQQSCGACWAFSTVETVEAMAALKTGELHTLSVQELVDCARNGNFGCEGGDTCSLLEWLAMNQVGIELDKQYPLKYHTETCRRKGFETGVKIAANFTCDNLVGREDLILSLLASHGPVAVAVNAVNWQNYLGGVIQFHCDGGPKNINHAVQLVGYDLKATVPHYIARNSWGEDFGDGGYLYLGIGSNLCGLATEVSSMDIL